MIMAYCFSKIGYVIESALEYCQCRQMHSDKRDDDQETSMAFSFRDQEYQFSVLSNE